MFVQKRVRLVALLAIAVLLLAQVVAFAAPKETPRAYLVGFRQGHSAKSVGADGVKVKQEWDELGAALVEVDSKGKARLESHAGVAWVEEDRTVTAFGQFSDNGEIPWGLAAVHAQDAWNSGADGSGIKVCILDTGIDYNHPEFVRNGQSVIKASRNFVADGHPDARDGAGHGTHVAGTIAAQLNGSGVAGVAPGVDLYIGRVLGDDGSGTTSGVINGLNWCVSQGAKVVNLSLGASRGSKTEQRAFDSAYSNGVLSVAANGNDGTNRISYPAAYSSVVAVAAVDSNLVRASFSNYGSATELAGPGVAVLSSVPLGTGLQGSASEGGVPYVANPLEFSPMGNISGPLVECGLADSTTSCPGKPASGAWIAMVNRGVIAFADKVNNVKAQGASAAIIANNDTAAPDDAGSFTLGAAGSWIPTVSVSYNSGVAIRAGGLGNGSVSVTATDYAYYNGTSMATPHATAVAAVAWSAKPSLTAVKIRSVLQNSSQDLGTAGRDVYYGFGLVRADLAAALARNTQ